VELIEGEILEMSPIGWRHSACTDRANMLFAPLLQGKVIVRIQGPVRLSDNTKPHPDVILLNPRDDFYASGGPVTQDALLVIEVAESSIRYDRGPKLAVYAKYGVRELWMRISTPTRFWYFAIVLRKAMRPRSCSNRAIRSHLSRFPKSTFPFQLSWGLSLLPQSTLPEIFEDESTGHQFQVSLS